MEKAPVTPMTISLDNFLIYLFHMAKIRPLQELKTISFELGKFG